MPLEKLKENAEEIQENVKAAIESTAAYYKLLGFKIATKATVILFKMLLMAVFFLMALVFISIALALYLGDYYGNVSLGFLIVGGIYFVFVLFVYLLKDKIAETSILKKFSTVFFND
ncbi:competence protein [Flavobacterium sp. SM15]|uniref:competence protein n=1 Tax=Flavobacterium sp. SM15 TaxID=2908005 RepID=UPI001ED9DA3A|nr:competence protein [Flavobacterium sp. SM15]MCG2610397.1 competence protein [Flavobacterium sp. SM15]